MQVQEANYICLSGHPVSTALTYELHYTQLRDFYITLDGRNKEAAEMKHARSIMKAEVKHSMNIADSDANNSHSTDQSGRGYGRGHSHGCGHGQGRGRGQGHGRYHNFLPDDEYWNLDQASYDQ